MAQMIYLVVQVTQVKQSNGKMASLNELGVGHSVDLHYYSTDKNTL